MDVFKVLETERLLIRQFRETDEEAFISFMTNPLITNNLAFDDTVKTRKGAIALLNQTIDSYNSDHPMLAFAVVDKISGTLMGVCGTVFLNEGIAEIFYAFFPCHWGNGFATEVLYEIKDFLVRVYAVKEIHAFIAQQNIASKKVAEKAGFATIGLVTKENFSEKVDDYVLTL